jgi:hypothetical protein
MRSGYLYKAQPAQKENIMTTNSGQAPIQDRIDPLVEALMKGLIGTVSHPKAVSRTDDAIEAALAEAFMASLIPPAGTVSQVSSFDKAILAAALAPARAEALAPALAEALAPAIVKALDTLVSPKETSQESGSKERSGKQEWE